MLGSVGGYIGMILGLSFFKLPDMVYGACKMLKTFVQKRLPCKPTLQALNEQKLKNLSEI